MKILTVCGSLRADSSNRAALDALALVAPAHISVCHWHTLSELPFFNPDLDEERLPQAVAAWRWAIESCDAVVFCSPEYVGGIAALLKNALEWLGGSTALYEKPVAVMNTSPRARQANAALREVLRTLAAEVLDEACGDLPLMGNQLSGAEIAADMRLARRLRDVLRNIEAHRTSD